MSEHTVYHYWRQQPQQLLKVLESAATRTAPFVELYNKVRPDKLYLVGSGTSLNAQQVAAPFFEALLGIEAQPVISSRIPSLLAKNPMIVFISQGGSSTNTLEAMEALSAYPSICITGEGDCEIARRAKHHMLIGCDPELVGPKTVGYTASVLCFYTCAMEAAKAAGRLEDGEYSRLTTLLKTAIETMQENLSRTERWYERNEKAFCGAEKYVLVGSGISALACTEGALKILETVKVPAMAYEFEEYLHGPILQTDQKLAGIFCIAHSPGCRERMVELAACHRKFSEMSYPVIGSAANGEEDPQTLCLITSGESCTEVFEYVLPSQLIAARLPKAMGISEGSEAYDLYTSRCPTKFENGR